MILNLLQRFGGEDFGYVASRVVWGPVLPQDTQRQVANEQALVQTGIHSRRHAMENLGVRDPEAEFRSWLSERETILRMNRDASGRPSRGGTRERADTAGESGEVPGE